MCACSGSNTEVMVSSENRIALPFRAAAEAAGWVILNFKVMVSLFSGSLRKRGGGGDSRCACPLPASSGLALFV